MIYVKYRGRLGNNLFQWAFGRILSKLSGVPMLATPLELFPITQSNFTKYPDKIRFVMPEKCTYVSIQEWIDKARKDDVLVRGWPHNTDYFAPHRQWLKSELVPASGSYSKTSTDDITIHVRWGDYFGRYKDRYAYPMKSFCYLLTKLNYDRCLIVTDTPNNVLVEALIKGHRGILASKNIEHDYRTLYYANRLIMSPSTFSWWSAWTGKASEIYQPYEMGYWKREHDFALDLSRFGARRFDKNGNIVSANMISKFIEDL
jgi:hypothetical protein